MPTATRPRVLWTTPLIVAICLFSLPAYAKYSGGTGEPNDPYLIYTPEQMNEIGLHKEDWDKHFKLMADIDLSAYKGTGFNVIGTDKDNSFKGIFDGNSHKISNFTHTSTDSNCVGIFGYMDDPSARISNLGLIDPNVNAGAGSYVGSLVGWLAEGTVMNCHSEGGSVSARRYVGGLVGNHGATYRTSYYPFALISDCYATANVSGRYAVGGLAGYMQPGSRITDSRTTGNTFGPDKSGEIGGLVGGNNYGIIERCYATGDVSCGMACEALGGLLGRYVNGKIDSCYATGPVSAGDGSQRLGGFVGHIEIGTITNCYANGNVSAGRDGQYLGGFLGYNDTYGTIDSCYATGSLQCGEGSRNIGGLVGYAEGSPGYGGYGLVAKCFWDTQASGLQKSAGGLGMTTAEMMEPEIYSLSGWGGNPNWVIDAGKDYPRLVWEGKPGEPIPELPTDWFVGAGTLADPYQIATANQLLLIAKAPVLWDKCFVLVSDLDLAAVSVPPIGVCPGNEFAGTFNGNGHVISNLGASLSEPLASSSGLFGYIGGWGQVVHLRFENSAITVRGKSSNLGLLANVNYGTISDCSAIGSVKAANNSGSLGGLVGMNRGSITASYAVATVIAGESSSRLGGLVGENWGILTCCYATSDVSSGKQSRCLGGLSGSNEGNNKASITNCYARGVINGAESSWQLGGLVGVNLGAKINSSYAAAAVNAGHNSYEFGGLVGDNAIDGVVTKCYFLTPSDSGGMDNGLGSPLTDAQMKRQASFDGWDFVGETANGTQDIWWILEGQNYPRLWWEDQ